MTRHFDLQGHRGARGLFPENTLEGFRAALAVGVDTFELDVGLTADGVVVVHHDPALNQDVARGPDGTWLQGAERLIHQLTVAELAGYDVGRLRPGTPYAALFADQQPYDGARVPTLASVLRVDPAVCFNIEMKTDPRHPHRTAGPAALADATLAVIDAAGAAGRITMESFDWRGPRHVRRVRPDIRLAWLTRMETIRDARTWWDGPHVGDYGGSIPRAVAAEGGPIWAPDHHDLDAELVAEAHQLGLLVIPWTVNRPEDMRRLIGWQVDGLITDRPDVARPVLRDAGLRLPPVRR